ncbi:GatB/YqeY domain-containing protein [bacterium]|nr:GatB/YqeY domain-containing protein [bacterium]|tara:strand:- start:12102 stop:12533 length:432 start_codon:yes stop_codon:yes gene_type:complete
MLSKLKDDLKSFILAKNKIGSNVIRTVLSIVSNEGFKDNVPDEVIINIIKKEVKKRKEAFSLYSNNNREDLAKIESEEQTILEGYLPEQMSEDELITKMTTIKNNLKDQNKLNMGELIKASIKEFSKTADNSLISKVAKELIG